MLHHIAYMQNETRLNERKRALETRLSSVAGVPVEITIRGTHEFTASTVGAGSELQKVRAFLSLGLTAWEVQHDDELNESFAYFTVALLSIR